MVLTSSQMLPLGTTAPDFDLPDAHGKRHALRDAKGRKAVLVVFLCNHCPFVQHVRGELAALGRDYLGKGVAMFGINSNDTVAHPDDAPAKMVEEAGAAGYTFPYLVDATQKVAKAYRAACTPDFFLFDGALRLVYRGQLDDSRPGNGKPVTGRDLRAAIDALLAGQPVGKEQRPSAGCNIKWKRGGEPEWFQAG
jgi:peroxiredoxin